MTPKNEGESRSQNMRWSTSTAMTSDQDTQFHVANRSDIFTQDMSQDDNIPSNDSVRLQSLMQQMFDNAEQQEELDDMDEQENNDDETDAFSFRLFSSSKALTQVLLEDTDAKADLMADLMAEAVKQQQMTERDESNPEFIRRINEAAISYDKIMDESRRPYPTQRLLHKVIQNNPPPIEAQPTSQKKHKSKKRRDFEKAVRNASIKAPKNMRDPQTPGGWPGWPGHLTRCAIVYTSTPKKRRR